MPFASNDGARIYWRLEGAADKPVLVLLSSIGTDQSLFDRSTAHLLPDFRLLRIDTRGHGASDAPPGDYSLDMLAADVLAVMDAAGAATGVVCGVSLGGMIAMTLALKAPRRVEALVLTCTSARMDPRIWVDRIAIVRSEGLAPLADTILERFFSEPFRRLHPEVADTARAALLALDPQGYAGCGAAIRDMDLLPRLGGISVPTLVIGGTLDISTPFEGHGSRILAAIPGSKATLLPSAHLPPAEAPTAFSGAVRDFVRDVTGGGALRAAGELLFEAGIRNRRKVLGDAWVDKSLAKRTPFTADYQAMISRYAWHEVWGRPGLDERTRRLLVLAITASLARWEEFRLHTRAALEQGGVTQDELKEALMQIAVYAGVPAANTAFAEASEIVESFS